MLKKKPIPGGKLNKPEDKAWQEWFDGIDVKEHEQYLSTLGLDEVNIGGRGGPRALKKSLKRKNSQLKYYFDIFA